MTLRYFLTGIIMIAIIGACNNGKPISSKASKSPARCPATTTAPAQTSLPPITGMVLETINASSYTYVSVKSGKDTLWVAVPTVTLNKGDTVSFDPGMPMQNHVSKTLNRTFQLVYFAAGFIGKTDNALSKIKIGKDSVCPSMGSHMPPGDGAAAGNSSASPVDFSGITKPANGKTVAELFKHKDSFAGKKVILRGRVVKANYGILGKTWLHLRDGTGKEGGNDITVTTTDVSPRVGNIVLAEGTLNKDKDLGHGYKYPVIVEDANVKVEK